MRRGAVMAVKAIVMRAQVGRAHTDEVNQPIVAAHQTGRGVP